MKNQTAEKRLQPPDYKVGKINVIARQKKPKGAGTYQNRNCEKGQKIYKTVFPKKGPGICGLPNASLPEGQGAD